MPGTVWTLVFITVSLHSSNYARVSGAGGASGDMINAALPTRAVNEPSRIFHSARRRPRLVQIAKRAPNHIKLV